jgi:hypothetical protein
LPDGNFSVKQTIDVASAVPPWYSWASSRS